MKSAVKGDEGPVIGSKTRALGVESMDGVAEPSTGPGAMEGRITRWVARVQGGDPSAMQPLVAALQPVLLRDARRIVRDDVAAEDVFFTTLARLLARIETCEAPERFLAYARRSVRNASVDLLRARHERDSRRALRDTRILEASRPPDAPPLVDSLRASGQTPEQEVVRGRRDHRIHRAVESLREPRRSAVRRYYFEGWTLGEIGARIGRSEAGVKRLLGAARVTLAARLQGLEQTP